MGPFPHETPTRKIWKKLSVDQKDQMRRSVWVGEAEFFQNRIKKTRNSLNVSTACLFKKIDVHYAITGKCTKTKAKH